MHLIGVPKEHVGQLWPLAANVLRPAIERSSGRFSEASVRAECLSGQQQLWLAWDGERRIIKAACVTQIIPYPAGLKVLDVVLLAGEDRKSWKHLLSDLIEWGRERQCGLIQLLARKGWARELPDYRVTHVLLESRIDE